MLSIQRPNSAMDPDFPHGLNPSPYDHERQRRSVWGEQVPYSSAPYPADATTQLPPIQPQRNAYDQSPTSYDPVRRPTALSTTVGQSYSPYAAQTPQSPYGHGIPQYQHSPHMFNQSASQMSPLTPQYPTTTGYSPIRPMPALAGSPHGMSGNYTSAANYNFPPQSEESEPQPRLHVVGSQGRRGVLPSDEGRPPAVSNGATGTKSTVIPVKDADGKFPCPHCQKTYLHGKHLKRHLLRHTGDRPYSCFLCNDTFSRSDILKRHFQKCSQRRGNPTGASHLAYSQNHLKRQAAKANKQQQQAAQQAAQGTPTTSDDSLPATTQAAMNNTGSIYTDSNVGMATTNATQHQLADISTKHYGDVRDPSRSGGVLSPGLNRPNHNFLSGQPGPASLPSSGSSTPLTAKTANGQFPQTFQSDPTHRPNYPDMTNRNHLPQMPAGNQFDGNTFEWSSNYSQGKDSSGSVPSVDHLAGQSFYQNMNSDNQQGHFKTVTTQEGLHEQDTASATASGLLSITQAKADQLIVFCGMDAPMTPAYLHLRQSLTTTNIDHFIQQYFANFYQHFPIVHIPTFNPNTTYDGLLLAIICTGAAYSDRIDIEQTRQLARITGGAIKNTSTWFGETISDIDLNNNSFIDGIADQLHAYSSIVGLSLWHEEDGQKVKIMEDWKMCTRLAFKLHLNEPVSSSNTKFSFFHQPGYVEDRTLVDFSYDTWLWQEKRIRLMYIIFLTDTVLAFFFNQEPTLDPFQIKLPLPCDDAVWDAPNETECIKALGFYGPDHQESNTSGSLRKKQPEMHLALAVLENPSTELASRCTNVAGKFVLIHCMLLQFWVIQRFSTLASLDFSPQDLDWAVPSKIDTSKFIDPTPLGIVEAAADKWIKSWESDISIQYPPGIERIGYSRDGVHYYWLAKLLIQNCDFINVHSPWNERFQQILKILKNVKTWISGLQLTRGESTGAISLVDERYGLENLSKDLKLLMAPL